MTLPDDRRTVLFHRDFRGFTGGHLKVWHYFCHVAASPAHQARIHFTPASRLDSSNPWHHSGSVLSSPWTPSDADILFLAGMDWSAVPGTVVRPVVNLIQGFGHARPGDPRYEFLTRRALRICVSEEVSEAIRATGRINGPILTISNALDHEALPPPAAVRDIRVLVAGQKRPELAGELAARLERHGMAVRCLTEHLPRAEFLSLLGRAEIVVPLPLPEEGFFLPGLEGMAMGALVVCPDCHGNRSWCRDNETGFRPLPTIDAIATAVTAAHGLSAASRESIVAQAQALARSRSLADERNEFLDVFSQLDDIL